eukprot:TRINITY_DN4883_c0_g1_i1.p1 TRINITY_DN4883_c0_g1~~TRINITY_DN4883_c0_g1_i1.p1  ORF type:complete len:190 (+),score=37.81 TRINITY_DN4883_c0_g1_i1:68-637(+)
MKTVCSRSVRSFHSSACLKGRFKPPTTAVAHYAIFKDDLADRSNRALVVNEFNSKFIRYLMRDGKKEKAERIVMRAWLKIRSKYNVNQSLWWGMVTNRLLIPAEMRDVVVAGNVYKVPSPVSYDKAVNLSLKWIADHCMARETRGSSADDLLAKTTESILSGRSDLLKKRSERVKSIFDNRSYFHYRWW